MLLLEGMASIRSCLAAIVCQSTPPAFPQFSVHKFFLQDPMSALGRKWTLAVVEIMVIDWQSIRNPYNHDVAQ